MLLNCLKCLPSVPSRQTSVLSLVNGSHVVCDTSFPSVPASFSPTTLSSSANGARLFLVLLQFDQRLTNHCHRIVRHDLSAFSVHRTLSSHLPTDLATSTMLNGRQRGQLTSQYANPSQSSNVVTIPDPDLRENAIGAAITKLEDILVSVQDSLRRNQEMSIPYRSRRSSASHSTVDAARPTRSRTRRFAVCFPGRTVDEAVKFSA